MNYVPNQNGKVLEEMLVGFNSDDAKTSTLFQNHPPFFARSSEIFSHTSVTLITQ